TTARAAAPHGSTWNPPAGQNRPSGVETIRSATPADLLPFALPDHRIASRGAPRKAYPWGMIRVRGMALGLAVLGLGAAPDIQVPPPTPAPAPTPTAAAQKEYCSVLRRCALPAPRACTDPLSGGVDGVDYDDERCGPPRDLSARGVDPTDPAAFRLFR